MMISELDLASGIIEIAKRLGVGGAEIGPYAGQVRQDAIVVSKSDTAKKQIVVAQGSIELGRGRDTGVVNLDVFEAKTSVEG